MCVLVLFPLFLLVQRLERFLPRERRLRAAVVAGVALEARASAGLVIAQAPVRALGGLGRAIRGLVDVGKAFRRFRASCVVTVVSAPAPPVAVLTVYV